MSGVDTSNTIDAGLADEDGRAKKEEERFKKQFEKKKKEAEAAGMVTKKEPEPAGPSSGFTMDQIQQAEKLAEEKKKQREEQKRLEAFVKNQQPAVVDNSKNIPFDEGNVPRDKGVISGVVSSTNVPNSKDEKTFLQLQVEQFFERQQKNQKSEPTPPNFIGEEAKCGKKFSQRILDQINFARTNPKDYAKRVLELLPFIQRASDPINPTIEKTFFRCSALHADQPLTEGTSVVEELVAELDRMTPAKALTMEAGLSTSCLDLVDIQGPRGWEGREGETDEQRVDRFFRYTKTKSARAAQASQYGAFLPIYVVFSMLLDDGNKDRSRRRDLLDPDWGVGGVHGGKHSSKLFMTVVMLAEGVITSIDQLK